MTRASFSWHCVWRSKIPHSAFQEGPWIFRGPSFFVPHGYRVDFGVCSIKLQEETTAMPGPDGWSEALFQLESIAKIARRVGDWELVEHRAQKMIQHDPSYAGGAMGWVAEHQGDMAVAREKFATAEKFWSKAEANARSTEVYEPCFFLLGKS